MRRGLLCWLGSLLLPFAVAANEEGSAGPPVRSILVKLRANGPFAVEDCAETLSRRGVALSSSTADGSDSLDQVYREIGVRSVRSVFRRPDGRSFAAQRQTLRRRAAGPRHLTEAAAPELAHVYRLELSGAVDASTAAARIAEDPHVEYAQPNHWVRPDADAVASEAHGSPGDALDDPFLHSQGSWGQPYADQWGIDAIRAPEAWSSALGEGVVVAVVDTGVDAGHPDLAGNLWVNPGEDLDGDGIAEDADLNGIDDDDNGLVDDLRGFDFHGTIEPEAGAGSIAASERGDIDPDDENGHGTHVAGIVAARGGNGLGIAGVAPRATLMPVRVFPPFGPAPEDVVWRGVLYAAENGARIVNASFSCGRVCRSNPLAEDVLAVLAARGVAFVTSAGNLARDVMLKSPERLRAAIVVGSIEPDATLAASSSRGLLVDVVAPGVDILSLAAAVAPDFWAAFRFVGDDYLRLSGTSMAAPQVSGVLALMLSADPGLTPADLRLALRMSARDLGAPGHDAEFGAGLVDAAAALGLVPLPRLHGEIRSPLPGDTLAATAGIVASVGGADLVDYRLALAGADSPAVFTPIETGPAPPFEDREIAQLELAALADGAYVLRLTLVGSSGLELHEFTPLSVEHGTPVLVSAAGFEALRPDIAGRRIAWESEREHAGGSGYDLLQGRFAVRGERPLVDAAGDQRGVRLSGPWAVWREGGSQSPLEAPGIAACWNGARGCVPSTISARPAGRPSVSRRRLVFSGSDAATRGLLTCRLGRGGCELEPAAAGAVSPQRPLLDGRRLVWLSGAQGLFQCRLGGSPASCSQEAIATPGTGAEPASLSGGLLAYEVLDPLSRSIDLLLCDLAAGSGPCAAAPLARRPWTSNQPFAAAVSGRRVVWQDVGAHGGQDIYLCEHDPETGACPPQRITHDAADQSQPAIDRHRVVFEDERDGVRRIGSFELPALARLGVHTVQAGSRVAVPVSRRDRGAPPVLSLVSGEERGARLHRRGRGGRAVFLWRPGPDQLGVHRFVLRATRPGGLHTERSLWVRVVTNGS